MMRTLRRIDRGLPRRDVGGWELAFALLFIQLVTSASVFVRLFGPRAVLIGFATFALLTYRGAAAPIESGLRQVLGWVGASRRQSVAAGVEGAMLGMAITAVSLAAGHSTRVAEPVHYQILAATLSPILEEICLRGLLVALLAKAVGDSLAVVISSVMFAFMHWPASILKLGCVVVAGLLYGSIRTRTGSTMPAAIAHTAYNTTILMAAHLN